MNDEIGNFFIKFTTEGFDKVEKQLNDLGKSVDKLNDSFEKGSKKGESFFGALLKWDITVGTITKSFNALKSAIGGVFDTAKDMTTLFKQEENLGVEAKVLERWELVAEAFDGSKSDAYAFFSNVNNLMRKASTPDEWSSEDQKSLAKAGIAWAYDFGKDDVQNRDAYLVALRDAFVRADSDPKHRTTLKERLRKYVGQDSYFTLFGADEDTFNNAMDWADQWRVLSKDPSKLQDVQDLKITKIEWGQIKKELELNFAGPLNKILKGLEPLKDPLLRLANKLGDWADKHADDLAKWVEDGAKWLINNFPTYWDSFVKFLSQVAEIVANLYDWLTNKGVVGKTWGSIKMANAMLGLGLTKLFGSEEDADKKTAELVDKYMRPDSAEGGYLGEGMKKLAGIPSTVGSNKTVTNNNNGGTVIVNPGFHADKTIVDMSQPNGAMVSSMYKGG